MLPEERARVKIDKQLIDAGWDIVARDEYIPGSTSAVKEALMQGNRESDYLLFVDDKAIAVVEAKREENPLGDDVERQAEHYANNPQNWYGLWFLNRIPLVYLANGQKIYFKNMLLPDSDYVELSEMHTPKKMLQIIGKRPSTERCRDLTSEACAIASTALKSNSKRPSKAAKRKVLRYWQPAQEKPISRVLQAIGF